MCYAAQQKLTISELEKAMNAIARLPEYLDDEDLQRYHINGYAKHYIDNGNKMALHPIMLIQTQENPKYLAPVMWGFIPREVSGEQAEAYYGKTREYGSGLNATSEKMFTSRMFKESGEKRRCVIPVTAFFEPHTATVKGKPFKVPFIFERRDGAVIKLAGIYEHTYDGEFTFAVLTKPATPLFAKIHNTKKRRPVILHDQQTEAWLNSSSSRGYLEEIIANYMPDESIIAQPISKDLYARKVDSNRPNISDPVHYTEIQIDYENKPKDLFG